VGVSVAQDWKEWDAGFYTTIAHRIAPWLGIWVMVAAMMSSFGKYNATSMSSARALWAMGNTPKKLPGFVGCSWRRYYTPVAAIIINAGITSVLVLFTFDILVQVDTFLNCITLLLEFAAFVSLKYTEPGTPRPFAVPGGKLGAWVVTIPKVIIVGATLVMSSTLTWAICMGLNLLFVWCYWAKIGVEYYFQRAEEKKQLEPDEEQESFINGNTQPDEAAIN